MEKGQVDKGKLSIDEAEEMEGNVNVPIKVPMNEGTIIGQHLCWIVELKWVVDAGEGRTDGSRFE